MFTDLPKVGQAFLTLESSSFPSSHLRLPLHHMGWNSLVPHFPDLVPEILVLGERKNIAIKVRDR